MARRLEITVSDEVWGRLESLRGHEPRASFVKRALESALSDGAVRDGERSVAPSGDVPATPTRVPVAPTPLPSIGRRPDWK